jgi:hypothetical protein
VVILKDFYSEGDGMGSSFYVDFPVYNRRKTVSSSVVVPEDNNVSLFTNMSQPENQQRSSFLSAGVNTKTLFKNNWVIPEEITSSSNSTSASIIRAGVSAIGGAGDTSSRAGINIEVAIPQILVVDDSSANR